MENKAIFTSVVRVKGNNKYKVVPVKSSEEVEKKFMDRNIKGLK